MLTFFVLFFFSKLSLYIFYFYFLFHINNQKNHDQKSFFFFRIKFVISFCVLGFKQQKNVAVDFSKNTNHCIDSSSRSFTSTSVLFLVP
jgi:hypothetical protein